MKNIFRKFEDQRPSLPSSPKPYRPFLQLSRTDIAAMFPLDTAMTVGPPRQLVLERRHVLVQEERQRRLRTILRHAQDLGRNLLRLTYKTDATRAILADPHVAMSPTQTRVPALPRYANVVLFDEEQIAAVDARADFGRSRHSMPSQSCHSL
ncbi:hypothetical protein H310_01808 [Aphanomyces invadans]|uniref:Uncharacterized protein n=1 Tax=Aphanomyces invadans TaxID=157072 RepID=A0A024ULR6_9STRA|nr:hypothetical protein H310_01808 [Aphanomyces invadans]ETW07244.1 hypothetical protein H310_01808 [Aphanomyces invadans]|eukprot:XP_008863337.1 hypothetical protein H310_01808 [Aphanomyces invadans]